jgi:hypothetical protein
MNNYEYIDRIIIAAEKQIENKKEVNVELVKTLIETLKDLSNRKIIEHIDNVSETQELLNYD